MFSFKDAMQKWVKALNILLWSRLNVSKKKNEYVHFLLTNLAAPVSNIPVVCVGGSVWVF